MSITHHAPKSICQAAKYVVVMCSLVSRALIIGQRLNQGSEWGFPFIILSPPWPSNLVVLTPHLFASNPPPYQAVTTGQHLTNYTRITPCYRRPQSCCCCLKIHAGILHHLKLWTLLKNHWKETRLLSFFPIACAVHALTSSICDLLYLVSYHWAVTITPESCYLQTY